MATSHGPPPPPTRARPAPDFSDVEETPPPLRRAAANALAVLVDDQWLAERLSGSAPGRSLADPRRDLGHQAHDLSPVRRRHGPRGRAPRSNVSCRRVTSILDFGSEAKSTSFERFKDEVLRAIILHRGDGRELRRRESRASLRTRCSRSTTRGATSTRRTPRTSLEGSSASSAIASRARRPCCSTSTPSWFQNTIDRLADVLMERYNRGKVVVLDTFQLYRRPARVPPRERRSRPLEEYLLGHARARRLHGQGVGARHGER